MDLEKSVFILQDLAQKVSLILEVRKSRNNCYFMRSGNISDFNKLFEILKNQYNCRKNYSGEIEFFKKY